MKKRIKQLLAIILLISFSVSTSALDVYAEAGPGSEDAKDDFIFEEPVEIEQTEPQAEQPVIPESFDYDAEVVSADSLVMDNADDMAFEDLGNGEIISGGHDGSFVKTTKAKFSGIVAANGVYKLHIYNPKAEFEADGVIINVKDAKGSTTYTADFKNENSDKWTELGIFEFSPEQKAEIILRSANSTDIKADSVYLEFISGDYTFDPNNLMQGDFVSGKAEYANYYNSVLSVGIYDGVTDNYKVGYEITRAEAAKAIAGMMNIVSGAQSSAYFKDVPTDHEYASYINPLVEAGVVLGSGNDIFKPDYAASVEEFVVMLIRLLGYSYGGHYEESALYCYQKAAELDMLDGISAKANDKLLAEDMTRIIYNTLDVPIVELTYSEENWEYAESEECILTHYLDAVKGKGVIEDNGITSLSDTASQKGRITIGGSDFSASYTMAGEKLGRYVEYYATESDDGDSRILYLFETDKNEIIRIAARDLEKNNSSYTKNNIVYYNENGRVKNVKIPSDAYVIYNGKALLSYSTEDFKINEGDITLISNDADSDVEVVIIRDVTYYAVEKVYVELGRISGYNDTRILDFYDEDTDFDYIFINSRGEEISISKIAENSVVAYMQSKGTKDYIKTAYLLDNAVVSGDITSSGDEYVGIGGTEYEYSDFYTPDSVVIKSNVKAYLTWAGNVFYITSSKSTDEQYGYIIKVYYDTDEEVGIVKFCNHTGVIETKQLAENIYLNGVKQTHKGFTDALSGKPQLVRYVKNSAEEITRVKTATDKTGEIITGENYDPDEFTLNFEGTEVLYNKTYYSFNGVNSITSSTLILQVPPATSSNMEDPAFYGVKKYSELIHYDEYTTKQYDFNSSYGIGAMLIISDKTALSSSLDIAENPIIITEQCDIYDEDEGMIMGGIRGYQNGTAVTIKYEKDKLVKNTEEVWGNFNLIASPEGNSITYSGLTIDKLGFGDIVQFSKNSKGVVEGMRVLYHSGIHKPDSGMDENGYRDETHPVNENSCYMAAYAGFGTVVDIVGSWIYYTVDARDGSGDKWLRKCSTSGSYYFIDYEKKTLEATSVSSLCVGDEILVRAHYGMPKEVMIIED